MNLLKNITFTQFMLVLGLGVTVALLIIGTITTTIGVPIITAIIGLGTNTTEITPATITDAVNQGISAFMAKKDMSDTGSHLDLSAGVELVIGQMNKTMRGHRDTMQKLAKRVQQPVFYTYSDQILMPNNGFGVIRLTGPDQGHIWYVRGIAITDVQTGVAQSNSALPLVFISAADMRSYTGLTQVNPLDWRDGLSFLTPKLYSPGQLPLRFNEELFIVFSTASSGHQYVAVTWVEDFEEGATSQAWSL